MAMKTRFISLLSLLLFVASISAQQLYMPRGVAKAFANGTRSMDGKPGPKYWQNKGVYNITLTVAPPSRTIRGSEEIRYTNNSPDTLDKLVLRLELNSHQPEAPREDPVATEYLTTGVHIDEYTENGKTKPWTDLKGLTFATVMLDKKLAPGSYVDMKIKWHVDLAPHNENGGREGAIDDTTFFIAYFYPRVAVYDDTSGWDVTPFTEGHEFYNDFNDYTLQVVAPRNFIVWATGDLQNAGEVLQPKFAERLQRSMTSNDIIHVATLKELSDKVVTQQSDTLTWRFKTDHISDVALAVSDHYIWDAGSVVVDKAANRRASVQAAYDEKSKDFEKMVEYAKHALDWESNNFPGTPYPFSKTTVVRGWADMEYPMMVNDSSQPDPNFTRFIVEHEILHSWFPFHMGINERRYAFMDEGWTTAFENLIVSADLGKPAADQMFKGFRVRSWALSNAVDTDLPIITPADAMAGMGYRNNEYGKPAVAYLALKDMLGDAEFKRILTEFIGRWNGKHTLPWDMFNTFNNVSGKDLNWFFRNWFFESHYMDVGVAGVIGSDGSGVSIKNTGGFAVPFDLVVEYADGKTERVHMTSSFWEKDQTRGTWNGNGRPLKSVTIDTGIYMDANDTDNKWAAKPEG